MAIELTLFFPRAIIKPKNAVLPRGFFDKLFGNKKNALTVLYLLFVILGVRGLKNGRVEGIHTKQ